MKLHGPVIMKTGSSGDRLYAVLKGHGFTPIYSEAVHLVDRYASLLASHIAALRNLPTDCDAIWLCEDSCEIGLEKSILLDTILKFLSLADADGFCLTHNELKSVHYSTEFKQILGSTLANCYIVKRKLVDEMIKVYGAAYRSIITHQPNVYLADYQRLDLPQRNIDMNSVERSLHIIMNKSCWLKIVG